MKVPEELTPHVTATSLYQQRIKFRHYSSVSLVLAVLFFLNIVVGALAVHNSSFELGPAQGAQIVSQNGGLDWATIFNGDGNISDLHGGVNANFIKDQLAVRGERDGTTFTSSAKNNDPVSAWHGGEGKVPGKDDLSNVYAYAVLENDELIIYAGLERLDPGGDSHVDIELNQDAISFDSGSGQFSGQKTENDLLLVMDFIQGGDLGIVEIRRWTGSEWEVIESVGGEGCIEDDSACAFNNGDSINGGPWANYDDKGKEIDNLPHNAFTEMGINVNKIIGNTCFATIQFKSRSSSSFNSELKDFAISDVGDFSLCEARMSVSPTEAANQIGNAHDLVVLVEKRKLTSDFTPAEGVNVSASLNNELGATADFVGGNNGCQTGENGTCTLTITSTTTGQTNIDVTAGDPVNPSGSLQDSAAKRWVNARLLFEPEQPAFAASQVGNPYVVAATLQFDYGDGNGFVTAPEGQTQGISVAINDIGTVDNSCVNGTNPCNIILNSDITGQTQASASWSGQIDIGNGVTADPVTTSADLANITWVDVQLTLAPPEAIVPLGAMHNVIAELTFDLGDGNGPVVPAPAEQTQNINFQLSGVGFQVGEKSCAVATCTITIQSEMAGTTTISATWFGEIVVSTAEGPIAVQASADAAVQPALSQWVAVALLLEPPQAANQIGQPHNLVGSLVLDNGSETIPATSATGNISFSLVSGPGTLSAASCPVGEGASCGVDLNANETGTSLVAGQWVGEVQIGSGNMVAASFGPVTATKIWVDARLSLTPTEAANDISDPHTLTATLEFDRGDGLGFVAVSPQTQNVTFTLTSGPGNLAAPVCENGNCTVVLTSNTPGTSTVTANWAGLIDTPVGTTMGTANPAVATKRWVQALVSIGTTSCLDFNEPPESLPDPNIDNDFIEDATPLLIDAFIEGCVKGNEEADVFAITINEPSLFTVTLDNLMTDLDVVLFIPVPTEPDEMFEDTSTEVNPLGRASAGRASAGRASAGRASAGRASAGRASAGRASAALIGGSFSPGVVPEQAVAVAPEAGVYYALVFRPPDAASPGPYRISVTDKAIDTASCSWPYGSGSVGVPYGSGSDTLILTNRKRLEAIYGFDRTEAFMLKLNQLADITNGTVIPLDSIGAVDAAYETWNNNGNYCNIQAANDVTEAIRNVIAEYPAAQTVVIAGSDEIVPFHRIPDQVLIANEREYALFSGTTDNGPIFSAISQGYIFSDDFYVDDNPYQWERSEHKLYIADKPIGRLAETPEQMITVVQNHLNTNSVSVGNCLTTGYEFLTDSADVIAGTLNRFGIPIVNTLNDDTWTADDLINAWSAVAPKPDLVSVNAHFEHYNALPAAGDELFFSSNITNFDNYTNTVAYSMGCHSGLNIPEGQVADPATAPDFPEAFAGQSAAGWLANTGFGYGMTETVADSEQLYALFTEEIGRNDGDQSLGDAFIRAKQRFVDDTGAGGFGVYEEKSLIQATLWGLPMHGVIVPNPQAFSDIIEGLPTNKALGLAQPVDPGDIMPVNQEAAVPQSLVLQPYVVQLQPNPQESGEGNFYTLNEETYVAPGMPVQPRGLVSSGNLPCAARGVLFKGGNYNDAPTPLGGFDPLVAIPSFIDKLDEPHLGVVGWLPDKFWGVTPLNKNLMFIGGQYNLDGLRERLYSQLTFDIICDNGGPNSGTMVIIAVAHSQNGSNVDFVVDVEAADAIAETVRVSCTSGSDGAGSWQSIDLSRSATVMTNNIEESQWVGSVAAPVGAECLVQAANNQGQVAVDTGRGFYYKAGVATPDAINSIGTDHTFTFKVEANTGEGFQPVVGAHTSAPATLEGVGNIVTDGCLTPGTDSNGECEIIIHSEVPGLSAVTSNFSESTIPVVVNGKEVNAKIQPVPLSGLKKWWSGSISLFKNVEIGPANPAPQVCFTLSRLDGSLPDGLAPEQCYTFGEGNQSHLFRWEGLQAGRYQVRESYTPPQYATMSPNPIGNIRLDDANQNFLLRTVNNQLFACNLTVNKQCMVTPEVTPEHACDSKIAATLLRYTGQNIQGATLEFVPTTKGLKKQTYGPIDLIFGQTLDLNNGFTFDVRPKDIGPKMTIIIRGSNGNIIVQEQIHTSCSVPYVAGLPAPLESGAGSSPTWVVVNFIEKDGEFVTEPVAQGPSDACTVTAGTQVTYQYQITNSGDPLTSISVFDLPLGSVGSLPALASGESQTLSKVATINATTTNEVIVNGMLPDGGSCMAPVDNVTVTVGGP